MEVVRAHAACQARHRVRAVLTRRPRRRGGWRLRPGHAGPAVDLKGDALIVFDPSTAHVAPKPRQRAGGRGATIEFRSNGPHARLVAARARLGLAMLPEPLVEGTPGLELVLPSREVGPLELRVFVNADLLREPRVTAMRDFLAEILRAHGAAS